MTKPKITVRAGSVDSAILNAKVGEKIMTTRIGENGNLIELEATVVSASNKTYSIEELYSCLEKGSNKKYDKLTPLTQKIVFNIIKAGIATTSYNSNLGIDGYSIPYDVLGSDYDFLPSALEELATFDLINRNKGLINDPENLHSKLISFNVCEILEGDYLNPTILEDYFEFMDFFERVMKDDVESSKDRIQFLLDLERGGFYSTITEITALEFCARSLHLDLSKPKSDRYYRILATYKNITGIIDELPDKYHKYRSCYEFKAIRFRHRYIRGMGDDIFSVINRNDLCPCGSGNKFKKCCS